VQKKKGTQGVIQIDNPNLVKVRTVKTKDVDVRPCLSFDVDLPVHPAKCRPWMIFVTVFGEFFTET